MGEADPRKATKNGDSKYLAALSDVRLQGSNEAVYFVLRGLGMKASPGPNSGLPRIEIVAAQHPRLYAALRRLGLRHLRDTIILEPSAGPERALGASNSAGELKAARLTDSQLNRSSKARSTALRMERKRMAHELIRAHRAAAPPSAMSMLPADKVEQLWKELRAERDRRAAGAPGAGGASAPVIRRDMTFPGIGFPPTRTAEQQEQFFARLSASGRHAPAPPPQEEVAPGPSLRLRPVRSAEEQNEYFTKLSVPRVVRPKFCPEPPEQSQSTFSRAARQHLLGRLEKLNESKQKEEQEAAAEARMKEVRRVLYGDDGDVDGIIPPDPSEVGSEDLEEGPG